ncbi:MAG: serine/threonine-protein kinase [Kofleriaceae bacterium]
MIGEILGDYRVVSQLAPGAIGDEYLGEHKDTGTKVSIKVLHPQITENAEASQAYLATVTKLAEAKPAGAIRVLEAGLDAAGRAYVTTEIFEGQLLAKRIEESGRLSATQIGDIGRQIANVLAATHEEGIVHGDLRPDVVFLLPQGGLARGEPVKLTELGVATLKRSLGIAIGPVYTAPELLGSGEPVDWRVDAYGLGCLAYEMATGQPPFRGASADEVRTKHLEAVPPAARAMMPDVPPALDMLIGRLLSKRPDDRFASMRAIGREFEAIGGGATQPLAKTAEQLAVVVAGEMRAQGEITAKPVVARPEPEMPTESIHVSGSTGVVHIPAPIAAAPVVRPDATTMMKKQGSALPIVLLVLFLLAGGGTALYFLVLR